MSGGTGEKKRGVRAKKALGQHFLHDQNTASKIVGSLVVAPGSVLSLLEIGPGMGVLTRLLTNRADIDLKVIEIDRDSVAYLKENHLLDERRIIEGDFLRTELSDFFAGRFSIIGNFPYNISTQILFKILEWKEYVPVIIGMFQKEVAERAAAKEGSKIYGVLSVLLQYYYHVEYLFSVGNECFTPQPKVQSGVIRLTAREDYLPVKSERAFWVLVKTAFNQRRKTLRNGVKSLIAKEDLEDPFFDRRAETLSVKEFAELTFKMI